MTASANTTERSEKIGPGLLVLIVGPSGAGKDTLIDMARNLFAGNEAVIFPRRVVTRAASAYENNLMITPDEFEAAVAANSFALSWRAHGHGYGLSHAIDGELREGATVVANISRMAVTEARQKYQNTLVVLVTAPDEVLAARLAARHRPSDGAIDLRLRRVSLDEAAAPDVVIDNVGDAEQHGRELVEAITARQRSLKRG